MSSEFLDFFALVEHDSHASCGNALAMNKPMWIEDVAHSQIFAGSTALEVLLGAGSRACASVPVRSPDGRVIAMINTHHNRQVRWSDRQKHGLGVLAATTGRLLHSLTPSVSVSDAA